MKRYILSLALATASVMLIGANGCADQEARNKIAELESKVAPVSDLQSRVESLENRLSELEAKISEMEAKKEEKKTGAATTKETTKPKSGPLPGKVK